MKNFRQLMGKTMLTLLSAALLYSLGGWQVVQGQNHPNGYDFIGPDGIQYPDFTFAGYHGGEDPIPDVPVVATVRGFTLNDINAAINSAISQGGGAVFFPAGTYTINDRIRVRENNIVLRGAGIGQTTIRVTGTSVNNDGAITFLGGFPSNTAWVENTSFQEGQKSITLPTDRDADVFLTKVKTGDFIRMRSYALPSRVKGKFTADLERQYDVGSGRPYAWNFFQVEDIQGRTITLNQPLRAYHGHTEFSIAWTPTNPDHGFQVECGIEDMTITIDPTTDRIHGFKFYNVLNSWVRRVEIIEPAAQFTEIFFTKWCTFEDVEYNGSQRKFGPGGLAYVGGTYMFDCLFKGGYGRETRHAPNVQGYSSGNVFTNIDLEGGNIDSHFSWTRDNLFERLTMNVGDGPATSFHVVDASDNYGRNARAPAGDGEVVYNCDIDGGLYGGSVWMGGLTRNNVIAHSRFISPGFIQAFRPHAYWPGDDIVIMDDTDNFHIVNNVFATKDQSNFAFPIVFMPGFVKDQGLSGRDNCFNPRIGQEKYYGARVNGCTPNSSQVICRDNQFVGHARSRQGVLLPDKSIVGINSYRANGSDFSGNTIQEAYNVPPRPTPPVPSIYEWQLAEKSQGSRSGTFPVELLNFEAEFNPNLNVVALSWYTASESNNSHFVIERSLDRRSFEATSQVMGAGNSDSLIFYQTYDENPPIGKIFYRLKQVDLDGTMTYSDVQSVNIATADRAHFEVSPNPVQVDARVKVKFRYPFEDILQVDLLNSVGQTVKTQRANTSSEFSEQTLEVSTESLSPGIYLLQVKSSAFSESVHSTKIIIN